MMEGLRSELNKYYVEMVDAYSKEDSKFDFWNSSRNHAGYIFCKMIERTKGEIKILTGNMEELYFEEIKDYIVDLGVRVRSIQIITVQENDMEKITEYRRIFKLINSAIGRRVIRYLALKNNGDSKMIQHFMVSDKKAWRLEDAHDMSVAVEDNRAQVCFNNIEEGKRLDIEFQTIWTKFFEHTLTLG